LTRGAAATRVDTGPSHAISPQPRTTEAPSRSGAPFRSGRPLTTLEPHSPAAMSAAAGRVLSAVRPRAEHDRMANAIRALAMGAADIATVLFTQFLKFDAADPHWPDRDRFVLSAGHGSMLLYAALHLLGYEAMTIDEIKRFRQLGSLTPGHPEYGHTPGVET